MRVSLGLGRGLLAAVAAASFIGPTDLVPRYGPARPKGGAISPQKAKRKAQRKTQRQARRRNRKS